MQIFEILGEPTFVGREHFDEFGAQRNPPAAKHVTGTLFNNCVRQPDNKRKYTYGLGANGLRTIVGREPIGPRPGLEIVRREELALPPFVVSDRMSILTRHCIQYVITANSIIGLLPELTTPKNGEDAFLQQLAQALITEPI